MRSKVIHSLTLGVLFFFGAKVWAQTPTPTSSSTTGSQAAQAQQANAEPVVPSPTIAPIEPPSLIPENSLPGPGAAGLPAIPGAPELQQLNELFKQSSLGKAADDHRLLVQMAELETHLRNDEELHNLKNFALAAGTDLERRHRLRTYYDRYYAKLRANTSALDLQTYIAGEAAARKLTLLQPRVRHEPDEAEAAKLTDARGGVTTPALRKPRQAKVNDIFHR